MAFTPQIDSARYNKGYDDLFRFISYHAQIDLIVQHRPEKMLEIGKGNGFVSSYIKNLGIAIDTCDFDERLNPTIVADVRQLPIQDNTYDLVTAFEVIEHIPWEDVPTALAEIARVATGRVIISIPYSSTGFEWICKFPGIETLTGKKYIDLFVRIPLFFRKHIFYGQHYWEMGKREFPISKIRALFETHFVIEREFSPPLNKFHYFFVLRKRTASTTS